MCKQIGEVLITFLSHIPCNILFYCTVIIILLILGVLLICSYIHFSTHFFQFFQQIIFLFSFSFLFHCRGLYFLERAFPLFLKKNVIRWIWENKNGFWGIHDFFKERHYQKRAKNLACYGQFWIFENTIYSRPLSFQWTKTLIKTLIFYISKALVPPTKKVFWYSMRED